MLYVFWRPIFRQICGMLQIPNAKMIKKSMFIIPSLSKTSSGGVLGMFLGSKCLLTRCLEPQGLHVQNGESEVFVVATFGLVLVIYSFENQHLGPQKRPLKKKKKLFLPSSSSSSSSSPSLSSASSPSSSSS